MGKIMVTEKKENQQKVQKNNMELSPRTHKEELNKQ
jgi:hypothetical protein